MNFPSFRRLSFGVSFLLGFFALSAISRAVSTTVVISEFRVRGPNGGSDEFIELYNLSASPVSIGGWKIKGSNNTGGGTTTPRATIAAGTTLGPGCHYLLTNSSLSGGPYSGTVPGNQTYATGITDDGGIAVTLPDDTIVDQVGMSTGSAFKEGTILASLGASNLNRGYERKPGGSFGSSTDTDNNASDFQLITPSDPQNTSSACISQGPTGIGAADPSVVEAGGSTLLTVTVTPGSNPTSTGITVVADLSSIGGSATQSLLDDGVDPDSTAGDNVFSYQATVASGTSGGPKVLPVSIADAEARSASASIVLSLPAEIYEIQGSGFASPFVGQVVVTRNNVVTALDTNGFYIQTPEIRADTSAETSNGIFVFTGSTPTITVGDQVDVQGTIAEFFDLTEFSNTGLSVSVDSSGNPLPAPFTFDANTPSPIPEVVPDLERFEGMLVRVENALANGPADQFGDVPIVVGSARVFREPGILFPGISGLPVFDGNPEVFDLAPNGLTLPIADIPAGAVIDFAEGPLSFAFGDYSLLVKTFSFTGSPQLVPVRDRNSGEFTVASQNVLRLFDTVDDPVKSDEVPTPQQYADRLNKFSLQIRGALKSPDVLIVQEAENLAVLQDLAAKIALDDPTIDYTSYLLEGNDIGGIDIGILTRGSIQVDSVEQFGKDAILSVDGSKLNDRPPLVLRGSYVSAPGALPFPITVIGVHQRSLSGIEGESASAARVRQKRHEQALTLSQYIQSLQAADPQIHLIVAGDFNAFEFTDGYVDVMGQVTGAPDPAGALIAATDEVNPDLTNQTLNLPADQRYSFVFDGSAQSLDHALTSTELDSWVRGAEHSRGNADAPDALGSDPSTALRSSDHDGTVVYLTADGDGDGFADDIDVCDLSNQSATVVIDGCDAGAQNDLLSDGCTISDRIGACAATAVTHEDFTACVTQLTNDLKRQGAITNKEKSDIQKCAGKARIP